MHNINVHNFGKESKFNILHIESLNVCLRVKYAWFDGGDVSGGKGSTE